MPWPKQSSLTKEICANAWKTQVDSGFPVSGRVQGKLDKCPQKTLKQQAVVEQGWALSPVMA